ncbi:specific ribonuclease PARN [Seminavis robusta]|uniref:Specific ribonuclease PARN n=1 Tax=Seminavis robusta TaxID=568900 RepID=A0A9N8DXP2_9STRA|nr:specific ribonuclease PARN [Seminavis robusta]|eukprot:Sro373_g128990.1 specific ribonuclease PARN (668) ;mRNA; f:21047-23442
MVNVTKSNFIEQSNDLIQRLPSAAFVSIDEEMTGISIPNTPRPPKDQTPNERYQTLKAVPEKFQIIQLGVCLFHEHPDYHGSGSIPEFVCRRYNFFMFPPADNHITREVVLNASSIAFLAQHNMDFDMWTRQGTPFVTGNVAEDLIAQYHQKQQSIQEKKKQNVSNALRPGRRRVELRRTEDIDFHARAMASLREWLDGAQPPPPNEQQEEGLSFLLPPANSFLRRALYESIAVEYPALILESAGPTHPNQIRVLRLNEQEQQAREERLLRESWQDLIVNKIGVWRVFMALSLACHGLEIPCNSITFAGQVGDIDWGRSFETLGHLKSTGRQIPMVVHNGYMDLMFLLTHFHSHKLPANFVGAKRLIHSYFPVVYDTKFMATECGRAALWNDSTNTALEPLFVKFVSGNEDMNGLVVLDDSDETGNDQSHDASYDAYMTGCVFAFFCRFITLHEHFDCDTSNSPAIHRKVGSFSHLLCDASDELVRKLFGPNKLYLMQSIYAVDLETAEDPHCRGMISESIFRISNFDPSVTTRTIISCLSNVIDTRGERVNFELYWCNDTTFLVAASSKVAPRVATAQTDILKEHGRFIYQGLRLRFPTADIVSWAELRKQEEKEEEITWSSRVLSVLRYAFGWGDKEAGRKRGNDAIDAAEDEDVEPQPKRRRVC